MESRTGPDVPLKLTLEQVEAISRAISEPRRFAMLQQIARQPALACSCLNMKESLSPATISHHIKELQMAGLLDLEREGRGLRLTLRRDVWQAYLRKLATI